MMRHDGAQADLDGAVHTARSYGYRWEDFVEEARELWVAQCEEEAKRVQAQGARTSGEGP